MVYKTLYLFYVYLISLISLSLTSLSLISLSLISLSLISFSSAPVHAAGFFTPPHGVRPLGRGGAGMLSSRDINALWYNPAMIAGIDDLHLTLDLTLLNQTSSFQRAPRSLNSGEEITYPNADNLAAPLTIPQLGIASNLGAERFVFALGVWAPNGATSRYSERGPQRYSIIDTEGSFALSMGLAVGWRVTDALWLGACLQNHIVNIRLVAMLSAWPGFTGDPETAEYDVLFEGIVSSSWTPAASFGGRLALLPQLELGLSAQLPVSARDDAARVRQRLPSDALFDSAVVVGDTVRASFLLPWILRAGIRYIGAGWDLELNSALELWSSFEEISIKPNQIQVREIPGIGAIETGDLSIPRDYQDALSVRLGGSAELIPDALQLSAGLLWEQSAIPDSTLSTLQLDAEKLGLSLGVSVKLTRALTLDLSYTHLFYAERAIAKEMSVARQINPTYPEGGIVVGAGVYQNAIDLLGLVYDMTENLAHKSQRIIGFCGLDAIVFR